MVIRSMRIRGTALCYAPGFASLRRAGVDYLLPLLTRSGSGKPATLSRRQRPVRYRPPLWRKGPGILTIICGPFLASSDTVNADELLYLRCNLSGTTLSDRQSKSYSDTVEFKVNLHKKEAWELHPDSLRHFSANHPRRITADIDEHAIRLSRGTDSDVRSSDISYRIDRGDGSIVFSYRVTWYYGQLSDDSLTLATGTCEKAPPIPPYVEHLPMGDLHHFF
jgi:hypothetical protein